MPRSTYLLGLLVVVLAATACKKDETHQPDPTPGPLPQSKPERGTIPLPSSMTDTFRPSEKAVVAKGQDRPIAVAVTPTAVVWVNAGTRTDGKLERGKGTIMTADKAGGAPRVLASGQTLPDSVRVDDAYAYWTTEYDLRRVPLAGGKDSLVFEGNETFGSPVDFDFIGDRVAIGLVHPDGGGLYFVDKAGGKAELRLPVAGGVGAIAGGVDAVFAYARERQTLGRVPIGPGEPTTIATDLISCASMIIDGGKLYWTAPAQGKVWVVPVDGDKPSVFYGDGRRPWGLAQDAAYFYLSDRDAGHIIRIPKTSGAPNVVVTGLKGPHAIAVDDAYVYWTSPETGEVGKAAKAPTPR